jgi:hypothetical protein
MIHYMIDIETLATDSDALVLSIALVKFTEQEIISELTLYPSLWEQEQRGRKISMETLLWWMKSIPQLQEAIDPEKPRKSLSFCYNQIAFFLCDAKNERQIWAKAPSFDLRIVSSLLTGAPRLWTYQEEQDVRTAELKLKQLNLPITRSTVPHSPIHDALAQVDNVQRFLGIG